MENIKERIEDILSTDPSYYHQRSVLALDTNIVQLDISELSKFISQEYPDFIFFDFTSRCFDVEFELGVYLVHSSSFSDPAFLNITPQIPIGSLILALVDNSSTQRDRKLILDSSVIEENDEPADIGELGIFFEETITNRSHSIISHHHYQKMAVLSKIIDYIKRRNLTNVFIVSKDSQSAGDVINALSQLEVGSVSKNTLRIPIDHSNHTLMIQSVTTDSRFNYADLLVFNEASSIDVERFKLYEKFFETIYLYTPEYAGYSQEKAFLEFAESNSANETLSLDICGDTFDQLSKLTYTFCGLNHSNSDLNDYSDISKLSSCQVFEVNKRFLTSGDDNSEVLLQKILFNLNSRNYTPNYSHLSKIFDEAYKILVLVNVEALERADIPDIYVVSLVKTGSDTLSDVTEKYALTAPASSVYEFSEISLDASLLESMGFTKHFVECAMTQKQSHDNGDVLLLNHYHTDEDTYVVKMKGLTKRNNFSKNGFKPIFCDTEHTFVFAHGPDSIIDPLFFEFQCRFVNLLPSCYRSLNIIDIVGLLGFTKSTPISVDVARSHFTLDEIDNLSCFKKQVIDMNAISYLIKKLANLCFYNGIFEKELGQLKRAILFSIGLQRRPISEIATDLGITRVQVEAYARSIIISFVDYLTEEKK